ncbi:unnamed protein product, partial [Polarella glacialis]
ESLASAAHIKWRTFLRIAYDARPPPFLEDLKAEAQRTAADRGDALDADEGLLKVFAALAPEDRAAAIQEAVRKLAREVVGNDELAGDSPLLESGMDSLSGVEFRNRIQLEFGGGLRIPNSAVFDFPTADALAGFVNSRVEGGSATGTVAMTNGTEATASSSSSSPPRTRFLEQLNERAAGRPLFLVPGAGLQ